MNPRSPQPLVLLDAWRIAVRYRWRLTLTVFVAGALALGASLLLPRRYKAEASFERRTDAVLADIINRGAALSSADPRTTISEELAGQAAIDDLARRRTAPATTRPDQPGEPESALAGMDAGTIQGLVAKKVTVNFDASGPELDRVRVTFLCEDARIGREVVNSLVGNYLHRTRQKIDQRMASSSAFFKEEVGHTQKTLDELETRKLNFEVEHGELLADNPAGVQSVLAQAQNSLGHLQQQRESLALRIESLKAELGDTPEGAPSVTSIANPEVARLEGRVRDLQKRLSDALGPQRMTERHPEVVEMRRQIEQAQAELAKTDREVVTQRQVASNPKRAELEIWLTTAASDLRALDSQITSSKSQVEQLNGLAGRIFPVRSEYLKINRQIDEQRRQLAFWEDNLRRVQLALTASTGTSGIQLDFVKPCEELARPVSPTLGQVLLAAAALALFAGGASVFLAYRGEERFFEAGDLAAAYDLPVVGSVGGLISKDQRRLRWLRHWVVSPLNLALMAAAIALLVALAYLALERPEAFDRLRQRPAAFLHRQIANLSPSAPRPPQSPPE